MEKYIGITIGPITRITTMVKSTKALWASSYFFCYLAKNIIAPFKERTFIYPIVNKKELWNTKSGIGCFPDRYVFQAEEGDFEILKERIANILSDFSLGIATVLTDEKSVVNQKDVLAFLKNYLKIYCFEKEADITGIANIFNSIFDLLEMQDCYNLKEQRNYLRDFFEYSKLKDSFLVSAAFDKDYAYFEAIDKISSIELKDKQGSKQMAYHNYIGIISADGDFMGRTINSLSEENRSITELSERLYDYGQKTIKICRSYGARVIYLGGDDLMIFAPIKYGEKTIFDLMQEIGTIFDTKMSGLPNPPTLSFGLSITYNKFPMGEALEYSQNALEEAKTGSKNAIVCKLQKHSGQTANLSFKKGTESCDIALGLLNIYIDNNLFLDSLTHFFGKNEQVYQAILSDTNVESRNKKLDQYKENSLNEDIHKKQGRKEFIAQVNEYIKKLSIELSDEKGSITKDNMLKIIQSTTSLLRVIHFINTEKDE